MEAISINLVNQPKNAKINYQTHVQSIGWQSWVKDGEIAGTTNKGLRMEAIKITLTNYPGYKVYYRAHVQDIGWQAWVSDGQVAGTTGKKKKIEALEIKLIKS